MVGGLGGLGGTGRSREEMRSLIWRSAKFTFRASVSVPGAGDAGCDGPPAGRLVLVVIVLTGGLSAN